MLAGVEQPRFPIDDQLHNRWPVRSRLTSR
jgi:hypothetical protein